MSKFYAKIKNLSDEEIITDLELAPTFYRHARMGGPDIAEVKVRGEGAALWSVLSWLGYWVEIYNPDNVLVWWGEIEGAAAPSGGALIGLTLDGMYNRVALAYTSKSAAGIVSRGTTEFAEDANSIRLYGTRETILSMSNTTAEAADARRDQKLDELASPKQFRRMGTDGSASLYCKGLIHALKRKRYSNSKGRHVVEYIKTTRQLLGWGGTSTQYGLATNKLHSFIYDLGALKKGDRITTAGMLDRLDQPVNLQTYVVGGSADGDEADRIVSDEISFEAGDDIYSNGQFSFIQVGKIFHISGANEERNNGYHLAETADRSYVSTENRLREYTPIVTEGAGNTITCTQGQSVKLDTAHLGGGSMTDVPPGDSITLTVEGQHLAVPFVLSESWELAEIVIKIAQGGNVGDNVSVQIATNNGGIPGTQLGSGSLAGSSLAESASKTLFELDSRVSLSSGVTYWLTISRSGSMSTTGWYEVTVSDDPAGTMLVHDGTSWLARTPAGFIPFELWGHVETTGQIYAMATDCGAFSDVQIRASSGVYTRQYRNGDKTAHSEMQKLLDSADTELVVSVTPDKVFAIDSAPTPSEALYKIREGKEFVNKFGVALSPGVLAVGGWVEIDGIPEEINSVAQISPYRVEAVEYNVSSGAVTVDPIYSFEIAREG